MTVRDFGCPASGGLSSSSPTHPTPPHFDPTCDFPILWSVMLFIPIEPMRFVPPDPVNRLNDTSASRSAPAISRWLPSSRTPDATGGSTRSGQKGCRPNSCGASTRCCLVDFCAGQAERRQRRSQNASALWLFNPHHESLDPIPFIRLLSPLAHKNRKLRWIARGTNWWHTFSAQFTAYQSPPDPLRPVFDLRRLVNMYGRCRSVNLGPWRSTRAAGWRHINS